MNFHNPLYTTTFPTDNQYHDNLLQFYKRRLTPVYRDNNSPPILQTTSSFNNDFCRPLDPRPPAPAPSSDMQISLKQFLQENGTLLLFSRNCMLLLLEVLHKHRVEHRWQKSWNIRRQRKKREKLGAQRVADLFRKEVSSMPQRLET